MLEEFLNYINQENLFQPGDKILLAISGGVDSCVMAELFHRSGISFDLAHCNFQLRGDESTRDEQFVRQLAEKYNVPLLVCSFETRSFARKNKLSIQMAARKLRYDWFDELIAGGDYDYVATAHHLDDQIETFLINLSRGTGIAGLHGILPKQGKIIRPLLFASRQEIEKFALENRLDFVEDSSNASLKYARNRIRHRIVPEFEKLNPSFREEMKETIHRIRDAEVILNSIVDKEKKRLLIPEGTGYKLEIAELKKLMPAGTWLYMLLSGFGFTSAVVDDILSSLDEQPGKLFYSPTNRLVKDREFMFISPEIKVDKQKQFKVLPDPEENLPILLEFNVITRAPEDLRTNENSIFIDYDSLKFPLTIRKWRRGDYFFPFGMKNKKKLSDFFIDLKFSIPQKENTWLLCSGDDIAWVIGVRLDDRFRVTDSTKKILHIRLIP